MAHCQQNVVQHSQDNLFAGWYLRSPRRKIDLVKTFQGGRTSFEKFREMMRDKKDERRVRMYRKGQYSKEI